MAFSAVIKSSSQAFSTVITSSSHACIPRSASPIILSNPGISTHFDFRTYQTSLIKEIDQKLNDAVPVLYPEHLHEAMRYSLFTKGAMRVPPVMCIAACELFGGSRSAAFPTACALEMAHVTSLVHSDLPCIDDSLSRRGQPSSHTAFGVDMALLAGGALSIHGFSYIVSHTPTDLVPETRILQIIIEIARSSGSTGLAGVRFHEVSGMLNAADFEKEKAFGEICQCSTACGGILGGASDDEIERLRKYGQVVGVLHQLVDDILKVETAETKKDGKDIRKGKSYVSVYGVEKALEVVEDLRSQAKKELDGFDKYGQKALPLYNFVDNAADRGFNIGE